MFCCLNPDDFNPDDPAQVNTYREILETCRSVEVVTKNEKAKYWQQYVDEQIDMAMCIEDLNKVPTPQNSEPENIIQAGPAPPPPPPAPAPPKPKLFRYPGAEGIKRVHFNGYRNN